MPNDTLAERVAAFLRGAFPIVHEVSTVCGATPTTASFTVTSSFDGTLVRVTGEEVSGA